jgi:hypothetical protein
MVSRILRWSTRAGSPIMSALVLMGNNVVRIGVTSGFRCVGIILLFSAAILPLLIFRARCRHGLSDFALADSLLSLLVQSGFQACVEISQEKAVQVLREFPPVYAIVLSVQAAGLVPVIQSGRSSTAVFFGVTSSGVFMVALTANLYWVIEASYAGVKIEQWQFATLMGLFLFGAALTFFLLDQVVRTMRGS